jgi:hypothetical protein
MNDIVDRFRLWINDRGSRGDIDISSEELLVIAPDIELVVQKIPKGTIRLWEKNGPYMTLAFIRQQIANNDGAIFSYLEREERSHQ